MSEPKIFLPNMVNASSPTTGNYGLNTASQIFDRNLDTLYTSSGANDDATGVYVTLSLGGPTTINRVMVLNHNMEFGSGGISLTASLAGSGVTLVSSSLETVDALGRRHTIFSLTNVSVDSVRLVFYGTQVPDSEKSLAEIIVTFLDIDIGVDFSSYDQRWREKGRELILGDGGLHRIVTPASNGRVSRYEANCQFRYMPEAMMDTLRNLKDSGEEFLFMPESTTRPQDVYLCHFAGPWSVQYSSSYKGAGYTVNMQVKEV